MPADTTVVCLQRVTNVSFFTIFGGNINVFIASRQVVISNRGILTSRYLGVYSSLPSVRLIPAAEFGVPLLNSECRVPPCIVSSGVPGLPCCVTE